MLEGTVEIEMDGLIYQVHAAAAKQVGGERVLTISRKPKPKLTITRKVSVAVFTLLCLFVGCTLGELVSGWIVGP